MKRLGLIGASVLFTLLALEAALRLAYPVPRIMNAPDFYAADPAARYVLKPETVKTVKMREFTHRIEANSYGFRGPEFSATPAPGTVRVLLLGDSFTFGWGVDFEDTYGAVLEASLNKDRRGERFEVLNSGVPGYNTLNELRVLQTRGATLKPDYVILQMMVNDDVRDNLLSGLEYRTVVENTLLTTAAVERARARFPPGRTLTVLDITSGEADTRSLYERIKAPFNEHSHLYRFVVERIPTPVVDRVRALLQLAGFSIQYDQTQVLSREQIEVFEIPRTELIDEALTRTRQYVREVKSVAEANGARLLLVIFPSIFEVDATSRARLLDRLGMRDGQVDVDAVKNDLLSFAATLGIPNVDLHPVVRARYAEQPYFPIDGHFNELGYRLAGETVAKLLQCVHAGTHNCPALEQETSYYLAAAGTDPHGMTSR